MGTDILDVKPKCSRMQFGDHSHNSIPFEGSSPTRELQSIYGLNREQIAMPSETLCPQLSICENYLCLREPRGVSSDGPLCDWFSAWESSAGPCSTASPYLWDRTGCIHRRCPESSHSFSLAAVDLSSFINK
eukprot:4105373-Amphidinium_carterae.1